MDYSQVSTPDLNILTYHNVFSNCLTTIFNGIMQNEIEQVRKLIMLNIFYADAQIEEWRKSCKGYITIIDPRTGHTKKEKLILDVLMELTEEQLIYVMSAKQKEAGIAPTQTYTGGSVYDYLRRTGRIGGKD